MKRLIVNSSSGERTGAPFLLERRYRPMTRQSMIQEDSLVTTDKHPFLGDLEDTKESVPLRLLRSLLVDFRGR